MLCYACVEGGRTLLGSSGVPLGLSWGPLRILLGRLGILFSPSCDFRDELRHLGELLGASGGVLGASWEPLGGLWGPSGGLLSLKWSPK